MFYISPQLKGTGRNSLEKIPKPVNHPTLDPGELLKTAKSIISEECRPRKSKVVGFGLVEETQFDKLPQENEEVIQSASDSTTGRAGTSGLSRSPPSHSPPGRRRSTRSSSILPDESTTERSSQEDTRIAESFTALRNALQDDENKSM